MNLNYISVMIEKSLKGVVVLPKSKFINPSIREKGKIEFKDIDLNTYQKKLKDVKNDFPEVDLLNILKDMRLIREFETMLANIRTVKTYNGVEYSYTGPAHLYLGEEASAVGAGICP